MKIAIISDIHANLEALDAVLEDIAAQRCAKTYCLGDVVGYGPAPNEACARLRALGIETVQGNHDEAAALNIPLPEALLNPLAYKSLQWTRSVLSEAHRTWLRHLPQTILIPELDACLCHASPRNPLSWEYVRSRSQAWSVLEQQEEAICFIGHTHRPFVWSLAGDFLIEQAPDLVAIHGGYRYLINVGSVGQPRNGDPRCSYAIADAKTRMVTFRQVEYAISRTQEKMRAQDLPVPLADRLRFGL